ncbi:MAG: hypothetical protein WC511_01305 [Candidatus Pacearchaeota archaeon]
MKRGIIFFIFVSLFLINFAGSDDLISVNSGGDLQLCIDSGEGFDLCFAGGTVCVPASCLSLGYECGTVTDGCGITLNCGSCSSGFVCSSGNCVAESGGGGGGTTTTSTISVTPNSFNLIMLNGTYRDGIIEIKNSGTSSQTLAISKTDSNGIVSLENFSVTVPAGATRNINIKILAPIVEGNYFATIRIGTQTVSVNVTSKSKFLLFDSNIVILNPNYKVMQSDLLKTKVELTPMGDKERMDVTLNYVIADAAGQVYLTQSETVLVEDKLTIYRNFGTGMLPLGDYIVGLELIYPNGVAPSSARFKVIENIPANYIFLIPFVLMAGILIDIILIIVILARIRKRKQTSVQ